MPETRHLTLVDTRKRRLASLLQRTGAVVLGTLLIGTSAIVYLDALGH
jgi:hypothetical protein